MLHEITLNNNNKLRTWLFPPRNPPSLTRWGREASPSSLFLPRGHGTLHKSCRPRRWSRRSWAGGGASSLAASPAGPCTNDVAQEGGQEPLARRNQKKRSTPFRWEFAGRFLRMRKDRRVSSLNFQTANSKVLPPR